MKVRKKKTAMKKLSILALVIFIAFFLINLFWLATIYFPCYSYTKDMERGPSEFGIGYQKVIDDHTYSIAVPYYMTYSPFISLSKNIDRASVKAEKVEMEDGGINYFYGNEVTLFIWPKIGGTYQYGAVLTAGNHSYMSYVDENGNYIENDTMSDEGKVKAKELYEELHDQIVEDLSLAKQFWGLNGFQDTTDGIKYFIKDSTGAAIFMFTVCSAAFILILSSFIWLFKIRLPFETYVEESEKERKSTKGRSRQKRRIVYKKQIKEYTYFSYRPSYLKNDGWLSVIKDAVPIKLTVYPDKKGDNRYIVKYNRGNLQQNMKMIAFLENDDIPKEDKEEVTTLFSEAKEFWGFEK